MKVVQRKCREFEEIVTDVKECLQFQCGSVKCVWTSGSKWISHKLVAIIRVLPRGIHSPSSSSCWRFFCEGQWLGKTQRTLSHLPTEIVDFLSISPVPMSSKICWAEPDLHEKQEVGFLAYTWFSYNGYVILMRVINRARSYVSKT